MSVPGFPIIGHIACNFLVNPCASVSVEHLFNKSCYLYTDLHSLMKAETATKAMCSKAGLRDGFFKFDAYKMILGEI
ncbi:hypothetical protein GYMLUDRAFT_164949 [Collybiopsis luxurians FD-317 M1]|uniref:Unplaced genomic scaffold GYMLUscaffold_20, whole genome shotgun sequence n=1 Tax=Collybiopsis luxurians FD-317 M1 TaxID=944289 RepID=A0A0D0CZW4_9AGAR|nr:hypothetical protein GYMLUDRAFT_164949 [Collybiopsis luxurians FD-317 M1]